MDYYSLSFNPQMAAIGLMLLVAAASAFGCGNCCRSFQKAKSGDGDGPGLAAGFFACAAVACAITAACMLWNLGK